VAGGGAGDGWWVGEIDEMSELWTDVWLFGFWVDGWMDERGEREEVALGDRCGGGGGGGGGGGQAIPAAFLVMIDTVAVLEQYRGNFERFVLTSYISTIILLYR